MRSKMCVAIITAALAVSGYASADDSSLGSVKIRSGSKEDLTKLLESVKAEHGADAVRSVFVDIGYVVGGSLDDSMLHEAYSQKDVSAMIGRVESLREQALSDIDGITVDELREKAAPIEHDFRLNRKKKAMARLPVFEEGKARVKMIADLHSQIQLLGPNISRGEDEYGFLDPSFNVTVQNNSDLTLRGIDLEVHAWSNIDTSVNGTTQMRLMFDNQSIETGGSFDVSQGISPLAELTAAVAQGAGKGIRMRLLVVYTVENGRTEMKGEWTDEMEANRLLLKAYSEYDSDAETGHPDDR